MAEIIANLIKGGSVAEIKSVHVEYNNGIGNSDASGNALITALPSGAVPIAYVSDINRVDANYNFFCSSINGNWYLHLSNFSNGSSVTNQTNLAGTIYYLD
jgi:hypothetical protein